MAKPKLERVNKGRVVSFRLTDEQMAPYEEKIKAAGLSQSAFFRETFLQANPVFEQSSQEYERLLFYYSKASNNLNQLAHSVNRAWKGDIISQALYAKWLNELISIRELIAAGVNNADKTSRL
ncbi:molybdopterin-guanine dinucleotide biosynthesis protein MobC (plasmid) [Pseudomonas sp. R4-76]|uniref:plasmid mobilization protein n=1 Tax=unclassified Pseudomonas TaxID=196821 RepID=UPI003DA84BFB